MAKKGGLGRGIEALINETVGETNLTIEQADGRVEHIALQKIHRNPRQPRQIFDEDELEELVESIKQVGVIQPILVRADGDGYEIIAGERRYQASKQAGLTTIPAIVRTASETESLELALIENLQRSDLNSIEEAQCYKTLIEKTSMTHEELATRLSKSRSSITNTMRLLDLPVEIQDMVLMGQMSAGHARAILSLENDEERIKLANRVVEKHLSVRETENLASKSSDKTEKKERVTLPSSFKRVARQLKEQLSAPVKIKQGNGSYKLEISFKDEDDLARLLGMLGQMEDAK